MWGWARLAAGGLWLTAQQLQDFREGNRTFRRFAWVDGKKPPKGWHVYIGSNVVTLVDGRTVRFNSGGTYNVIGTPPAKVIETNAGLRNAAIGSFHGSVPFGKTITNALSVNADEDSAEYQAGDKAGFAASTALNIASLGVAGAGRAAGSMVDDGTTTLYRGAQESGGGAYVNAGLVRELGRQTEPRESF